MRERGEKGRGRRDGECVCVCALCVYECTRERAELKGGGASTRHTAAAAAAAGSS